MIDFLGWLGVVFLSACGLPQLAKTLRTRSVRDLSPLFLGVWLVGEVLYLVYLFARAPMAPLIANAVCSGVIAGALVVCWFLFRRYGTQ